MKPLVSVVIPVYNMGSSLEQCVGSLLNQDYESYEIILVDDGSKDNSLEVCRKLEKNSQRIRVFHTENRGSGPARNVGIEAARGDYIYFPDADDYLEPNGLTTMVAAAQDDCDLVVFGFRSAVRSGKVLKEKTYPDSIQSGNVIRRSYSDYIDMPNKWGIQGAPWNKLFKKSVIEKHNIEFPPLRRHQDEGFISRYMCFAERVHFIPGVLYTYYVNDLRKEWDKYPVTYIEDVNGLYQIRKQTILTWNPDDKQTRINVERSYINNFIKALELSFSPKMGFDPRERTNWISEQIKKYHFQALKKEVGLSKYQKLICRLIDDGSLRTAMTVMRFKVCVEKTGLLAEIKNLCR